MDSLPNIQNFMVKEIQQTRFLILLKTILIKHEKELSDEFAGRVSNLRNIVE